MSRPLFTLLLLSALTFLAGLGRQAITDSDEAFYAEASREMVESGDWLTPRFNYEDRWQKPVLYYWATATAFSVGGSSELLARLASALSGIGLVFVTWSTARRLTRDDLAAWIAGAVVGTCYGCFALARAALPDLPLAFFITGTIAAVLRSVAADERSPARWWALAGLMAGLGFLTKGPLAVVIPAIVLLPIWWRERRRTSISPAHLALSLLAFVVTGLPWYVAMTVTHGTAYLNSFFVGDNLERFATTRFNGPREIWFYVPIVIGGMLPWTMYLLVLPANAVRDFVQRRRTLTNAEWRLLIWVVAPLLLFTASVGKQPRYILPVLPPLAIMLGMGLAHRIGGAARQRPQNALSFATFATAAMFIVMSVLLFRARGLFLAAYPLLTTIGIALLVGVAVALAMIAATHRWSRLPGVMAASAAVMLLTLQFGALAGKRPEAVEEMAAMIRAHRQEGQRVAEYQILVRNLVFYTGFRHTQILDDGAAVEFLESDDPVLLVVREEDLDRLKTLTHLQLNTLGAVTALDAASVRVRTLLDPLPDQDLETIVLVSNRPSS